MKNLLSIILILSDTPDKTILFDEPVIIKKDGQSIFECWGAALAGYGIWLTDEKSDWHELTETDKNADTVIDAVYERLMVLKLKAA